MNIIQCIQQVNNCTSAYIKMQEPRLSRTSHAPAVHTGTLKPIDCTVAEIEIDEGK